MFRESGGWRPVGTELATPGDRGTTWFASTDQPAVRVAVTVLLDGTVIGFEVHAGGAERAYPPPRPGDELEQPPLADVSIGARLVRTVPLAELARLTRLELRKVAEGNIAIHRSLLAEVAHGDLLEASANQARSLRHRTRGRRGQPDRYYADLAVAYEHWLASGDRLAVLAAGIGLSESGLRAALGTARRKGFLTEAPKGRSGGRATTKAWQTLGPNPQPSP